MEDKLRMQKSKSMQGMSRNKLIATVSLVIILITTMTSNQLSIYASPTTEDDGYTYPDDASDEEKEEIDEQEQEAWEDAGRPGEQDNDNDNDGANPYCDNVPDNYQGTCHDRQDTDDITGLDPCNDGTQRADYRDCPDASDDDDNSKTTTIPLPSSTVVPLQAVNESRWYNNCLSGGEGRGSVLDFDTSSYETCGDNADGDKAYYDGFVKGCMGIDSANTKELCEAYVAGCLRATSVDNSETCYVADDTSSSAWKLVMTVPIDCEVWSADFKTRLPDRC
jgi:hypothetical protein